ncbi:FecR domain-containing protein [Rubrivivax gelatinosus]|uniref:Putative transmembrane sensor FecR n=1 Tax=Rubrivivax gelatinosus (strain NBRC 100245 / IL144) TaxID=983917 RepID=I0HTP8_RUBGI|nr:FecR domain-containing protein [Rubrivivax gelatinosus]BAL96385.1 putative transmembrane sensor FecR [Rubrivivax gelatinosus IL144]
MTEAADSRLDPVQRAALEWQVSFWSGQAGEAEQRAFDAWLAADPRHREAWARVQRVGGRLHALQGDAAAAALRAAGAPAGRRRVLRGLLLLVGAGGTAAVVRRTPQWQLAAAAESTAPGERRELTLADGSRLTLNTATALDLRLDAAVRRVLLRAGEVHVATAPDPAHRPFYVDTREGSVQALGTRFTVRLLDAGVRVQVFDGAVEVRPRNGGAPRRLAAGEQGVFDAQAAHAPETLDDSASGWMRGLLIAERLRLADFAAELGRYRRGVLRCDPEVAELRVSGVFPTGDTDAVLRSLVRALPVRVTLATRYWVRISGAGR